MRTKGSFLGKRIRSIGYAFRGMILLLSREASIQVQAVIAIIMTVLGFVVGLSATEWMIQCLTIALVMGIEGMNTAVEELADFVHPEQHPRIGFVKDVAAGAVFIAALIAVVVGGILYFPKIGLI
jgi:diacylglycerol kinase (ATP)